MAFIWQALSASVRGDVHDRLGTVNQDSVRAARAGRRHETLVIAVADGHGSPRSFRSDRGSAMATECARRVVERFVRAHPPGVSLSRLRREVAKKWLPALMRDWRQAVRRDVEKRPFSAMDFAAFPESVPVPKPGVSLPAHAYLAYGSTLLFIAITPSALVYAQIGDGDILVVSPEGKISRPLERHHQFHSNITASLCTNQALTDFQVKVEPLRGGGPALIMLSTDGYANCFGDDASFHQVGADFLSYLRRHGPRFVGEKLKGWLRDSSRDGSGDDITVGLAVRGSSLQRQPETVPAA